MVDAIRWSSLVVWLTWLIVYWRGGRDLVAGLIRALRSPASRHDAFLILGIVLLSNVMLWTGYLVTTGRIEGAHPPSWQPSSVIGGAMVLLGAVGTLYCRRKLGGSWSAGTFIREDHRLVDSGPYRLVRHPIYGLACTMSVGTMLVFTTWWNILAGVLTVVLYALKALEEEKALARRLPAYRDYQRRVRYRMAPWIW